MKNNLALITEGLNPAQKSAVLQIDGPSLIIAGAGSGKTRVLTSRIANILDQGFHPSTILALTFTNKASQEMKERIGTMVGEKRARRLWMGTFHSIFIRFLREEAQLLGYPNNFTIYDTTDSRSLMKALIKEYGLDPKKYGDRAVLSRISFAKNNLVTVSAYLNSDAHMRKDRSDGMPMIGELYRGYQQRLKQAGAMDFDDILLNTNILLRDFSEVLEKLQQRFSYILVDEYQDTNYAQYLIIKRLAHHHRNICVVGDDAQSIYAFRGARIENILHFKQDYPDAHEFKLEQNYRSTKNIVDAANSLIANNPNQLEKECFSAAGDGALIDVIEAENEKEEAYMVANLLTRTASKEDIPYDQFAILYRTNAQSRPVEEALRRRGVPYRIYGGQSFYDRKEVKDMLAYFRLLLNYRDDEAFKRVINTPRRGIGGTTLARLGEVASKHSVSLWEAVGLEEDLVTKGMLSKAMHSRLVAFVELFTDFRERVAEVDAYTLAEGIFTASGYRAMIESDVTVEGVGRAENLDQLFSHIKQFVEESEEEGNENTLEHFIEETSLMSTVDERDDDDSAKVNLMTIHSAKGLEFRHLYIIGMEDGLFPSTTFSTSEKEMEEERRLMYVAMTRGKESLTLSYAVERFRWGKTVYLDPSRFLKEIKSCYLNWVGERGQRRAAHRNLRRIGYNTSASGLGGSGSGVGSRSGSGSRIGYRTGSSAAGYRSGGTSSGRTAAGYRSRAALKKPDPNFKADPISSFREGQKIEHDRFGFGVIEVLETTGASVRAIVNFDEGGQKTLLLKYAKLRVVE